MRPITLLAYSATELPIGKGCLYACTLKLKGVTGVAYGRLSPAGVFSLAGRFSRSSLDGTGRWYSPELVRALVAAKGSGPRLAAMIAEAVWAAVSERDRRVLRPRPFVACVDSEAEPDEDENQRDRSETADAGA